MPIAMIETAQALAGALHERSIDVFAAQAGFTRSHQFALRAHAHGGGQPMARRLRAANILSSGIGLPDAAGGRRHERTAGSARRRSFVSAWGLATWTNWPTDRARTWRGRPGDGGRRHEPFPRAFRNAAPHSRLNCGTWRHLGSFLDRETGRAA
jgi:hypothetical protein